MITKPERPDLEILRKAAEDRYLQTGSTMMLWLLDMLERAEEIMDWMDDPLIGPEGAMVTWLAEYRGESDD